MFKTFSSITKSKLLLFIIVLSLLLILTTSVPASAIALNSNKSNASNGTVVTSTIVKDSYQVNSMPGIPSQLYLHYSSALNNATCEIINLKTHKIITQHFTNAPWIAPGPYSMTGNLNIAPGNYEIKISNEPKGDMKVDPQFVTIKPNEFVFVSFNSNLNLKVIDSSTGKPITDAAVTLPNEIASTYCDPQNVKTNNMGTVSINVLIPGKFKTVITAPGYNTCTTYLNLDENSTTNTVVYLTKSLAQKTVKKSKINKTVSKKINPINGIIKNTVSKSTMSLIPTQTHKFTPSEAKNSVGVNIFGSSALNNATFKIVNLQTHKSITQKVSRGPFGTSGPYDTSIFIPLVPGNYEISFINEPKGDITTTPQIFTVKTNSCTDVNFNSHLNVTVINSKTGKPIPNASVKLANELITATIGNIIYGSETNLVPKTNKNGQAFLDGLIPSSHKLLTVTAPGYSTGAVYVNLPEDKTNNTVIYLNPVSTVVKPIAKKDEAHKTAPVKKNVTPKAEPTNVDHNKVAHKTVANPTVKKDETPKAVPVKKDVTPKTEPTNVAHKTVANPTVKKDETPKTVPVKKDVTPKAEPTNVDHNKVAHKTVANPTVKKDETPKAVPVKKDVTPKAEPTNVDHNKVAHKTVANPTVKKDETPKAVPVKKDVTPKTEPTNVAHKTVANPTVKKDETPKTVPVKKDVTPKTEPTNVNHNKVAHKTVANPTVKKDETPKTVANPTVKKDETPKTVPVKKDVTPKVEPTNVAHKTVANPTIKNTKAELAPIIIPTKAVVPTINDVSSSNSSTIANSSTTPHSTVANNNSKNPQTGDSSELPFILGGLIALSALLFLKKRKLA